MLQIVRIKSPVLAVVTDRTDYVKARNQAEILSKENGLNVADMPMVIAAMATHPEVRKAIRPFWIDTITGEYHGQRDGDRSYEAWHSAGSLATAKGMEKMFSKAGNYAFMPISDDEWARVGKGSYNGKTIARVHLEDARKGNVPAPGTPYTIFVRLDKDSPKINSGEQFGGALLDYDTFMQDDRVLMICGSPESREALAKMLFGKKEEGGEGWGNIGSYHRINEVGFDKQAKGHLAYLDLNYDGLNCDSSIYSDGRFVGVCAGGAVARESAPQSIVQPTLEQILTVINNPYLDREGMLKAVSQLYNR